MKVYIAGPWIRRQEVQELARVVAQLGHTIVRDWWNYEAADDNYAKLADLARADMLGVMSCDLFVLLNIAGSEGKAVETGLALGRHYAGERVKLAVIGDRPSHIFLRLPVWTRCTDTHHFLEWLCHA